MCSYLGFASGVLLTLLYIDSACATMEAGSLLFAGSSSVVPALAMPPKAFRYCSAMRMLAASLPPSALQHQQCIDTVHVSRHGCWIIAALAMPPNACRYCLCMLAASMLPLALQHGQCIDSCHVPHYASLVTVVCKQKQLGPCFGNAAKGIQVLLCNAHTGCFTAAISPAAPTMYGHCSPC